MKKSKIEFLMMAVLALSGIAIIVGALLKLKHIPVGDIIFKAGFLASLFFSGIEIWRLRSLVEKLKNKN
jgi:hypothetical protein